MLSDLRLRLHLPRHMLPNMTVVLVPVFLDDEMVYVPTDEFQITCHDAGIRKVRCLHDVAWAELVDDVGKLQRGDANLGAVFLLFAVDHYDLHAGLSLTTLRASEHKGLPFAKATM